MPIRILIVDDHAKIRKLLKRHLETQENFLVAGEAEDGREGIAKAEALLPDVILMDVAMPGMDGIEATRIIHERLPQVKILILTLYAASENSDLAFRSGARGYVLKESIEEELVAAIEAIMEGSYYFGDGVTDPVGIFSETGTELLFSKETAEPVAPDFRKVTRTSRGYRLH